MGHHTHVKRYRSHYRRTSGHLYQGRYKSFPVADDLYFLMLLRYVEANPLKAKLIARAQDWEWSSLGCRGSCRQCSTRGRSKGRGVGWPR